MPTKPTCSVDECERSAVNYRGMCGMHYQRWWKQHKGEYVPAPKVPCSVSDCPRDSRNRGMCNLHYQRVLHCGDPNVVRVIVGQPERRFWLRVTKGEGCWEWNGPRDQDGYGKFTVSGRPTSTHRYSWELHFGPIPEGQKVCHHCDNPPCSRPDHLFLGTHADNHADRNAKGRQARGETAGNAKLTTADIATIRQMRAGGMLHREIAAHFPVTRGMVSHILRREAWAHVQ